ncbi:MAG: hypothetical protein ACMUIU_18120 [bacterium]
MKIKVECYSGFKADERPLSFMIDDRRLYVEKIIDKWRTPEFDCFKLLADDGETYLLKHDPINDEWAIE